MQKAKAQLWQECRRITFASHGDTCYTCYAQDLMGSNKQCGHFLPSSVCSVALRYDLRNLRPQCMRCNINLSGNWIEYEKHLIRDLGEQIVATLKSENEQTKNKQYDILWYLATIDTYKKL